MELIILIWNKVKKHPSNACMDIFRYNTISNYNTKLNIAIRLNLLNEVALFEFSYDNKFEDKLGTAQVCKNFSFYFNCCWHKKKFFSFKEHRITKIMKYQRLKQEAHKKINHTIAKFAKKNFNQHLVLQFISQKIYNNLLFIFRPIFEMIFTVNYRYLQVITDKVAILY